MNETIKSLAIQSGYQEGFRFAMEDFDLEKFAQLIVEETIHAIIKGGRGHLNPTLISKSAKEHFGI
jgi:hypothetical protein